MLSFFGTRKVPLILSPQFHYGRLPPHKLPGQPVGFGASAALSRERRNGAAFDLLRSDWLVTPISHEMPFSRAPEAYQILDRSPQDAMEIVLEY